METKRDEFARLRERRLGAAFAKVDNATEGVHSEDWPISRAEVAEILGLDGADLVDDVVTDINGREEDWS